VDACGWSAGRYCHRSNESASVRRIGFGWIIAGYLLLQAVVLWQMAGLARANPATVRPVIASFLVSFALNAFLAWKFFFAIPVAMAVTIAACLAVALVFASIRAKQLTNSTGEM
jgi:hypothetical protein